MVLEFTVDRSRIPGGIPNAAQLSGLLTAIRQTPNKKIKIRLLLTWKDRVSPEYFTSTINKPLYDMTLDEATAILKDLAALGFGTIEEVDPDEIRQRRTPP